MGWVEQSDTRCQFGFRYWRMPGLDGSQGQFAGFREPLLQNVDVNGCIVQKLSRSELSRFEEVQFGVRPPLEQPSVLFWLVASKAAP